MTFVLWRRSRLLMPQRGKPLAMCIYIALLSLAPSVALARTWYVAPEGNDSAPGTIGQPFASIQRGIDAASPGDTVSIGAGRYGISQPIRIAGKRASAVQPLTVAGKDMPTLFGIDERVPGIWHGMVEIADSSHVLVQDLAVEGSGFFGFMVQHSDNIALIGNRSNVSLASGIWVSDSATVRVEDNDVSRFCDRTQFGADARTGCQEGISIAAVNGFVVARNRVHDAPQTPDVKPGGGEGIDIKAGSRNGVVEGNSVWNLVQLGIYVDAYARDTGNIKIRANRVWNTYMGIVISSERGGRLSDVDVSDNLIHDVGYHGILVSDFNKGKGGDGPRERIRIYNNTIVNAGVKEAKPPYCRMWTNPCPDAGVGIRVDTANITGMGIHDNIVLGSKTVPMVINPAIQGTSVVRRNLVWPPGRGLSAGEHTGTDAIVAEPRLVNPVRGDYRLRPDSPAIGAGVGGAPLGRDNKGVMRPTGPIDLGAFTFVKD